MGSVSSPMSIFDLAQKGLSAQAVRLNTAASNLANAGSVSGTEAGAYRPLKATFATQYDKASGLATVQVAGVQASTATPIRTHNPGHPLADANGDVWEAPVDENAEMVEMLDSSRQYQNLVEAVSTAKQLILDTVRMK
jgi:flagellar basal-body rod protein FlgC